MVARLEQEDRLGQRPEAGNKYLEVIKPDWNTYVIGPSKSMFFDPILFFLSRHIDDKGELNVVDPLCDQFPFERLSDDIHLRVVGSGNFDKYRSELELLNNNGYNLKLPQYNKDKNLTDFRIPGATVDCIVDHDTSWYVVRCNDRARTNIQILKDEMHTIYTGYWKYLKPGGILFLQMDLQRCGLGRHPESHLEIVTDILLSSGFSSNYYPVDDVFSLPVSYEEAQIFQKCLITPFVKKYRHFSEKDIIEQNGQLYLRFEVSGKHIQHRCPDLFIARKR
jgi:hypothetical protein